MTVAQGLDNGVPTADMSPKELAPTTDDQMHWPLWGLYHLSGGSDGRVAEIPEAVTLSGLFHDWRTAASFAEREEIWHKMLALYTIRFSPSARSTRPSSRLFIQAACATFPQKGYTGSIPCPTSASTCLTLSGTMTMREMIRYIAWRCMVMIPTLILISLLIFTIIQLPPGDYFESYVEELKAIGGKGGYAGD